MDVLLTWRPTQIECQTISDLWPNGVRIHVASELDEQLLGDVRSRISVVAGYMYMIQPELVKRFPNLKLIHLLGHGSDAIFSDQSLVRYIVDNEITVARCNPATIPIAEYVVMSMILLSRRVLRMHLDLALRGEWNHDLKKDRSSGVLGGELHLSSVGLLGFGSIGQEVGRRLSAFGSTVNTYTRDPEKVMAVAPYVDRAYGRDELAPFLKRSDYLVICVPLTSETRRLVDASAIGHLPDGAFIVNVSRGELLDEAALFAALASGKVSGAALDVWSVEEDDRAPDKYPSEFPFHQFNVLMTPHYSGATAESRTRSLSIVGENLRRLQSREPIKNPVNPPKLDA